jgi:formylglycine-generating enzyme required for sulfatase activity
MGDSFTEGELPERPVRTVALDAFLMQTTETSKAQWDEVYLWALGHGYVFDTPGSAKAPTHPVQNIKWFDAVKWCNARSEKEGLVPCYYLDASHTQPYRQDSVNLAAAQVKWDASGYRLPTEAEWERAARGGIQGARFPWGDQISHSLANYQSAVQFTYDVSPTRGYHPFFGVGALPFTAPVASFPANAFGLHDMTGNVAEHCWDWYGNSYYAGGGTNNPRGPAATSGEGRVIRGGTATEFANLNRVSFRFARFAFASSDDTGFRTVRRP